MNVTFKLSWFYLILGKTLTSKTWLEIPEGHWRHPILYEPKHMYSCLLPWQSSVQDGEACKLVPAAAILVTSSNCLRARPGLKLAVQPHFLTTLPVPHICIHGVRPKRATDMFWSIIPGVCTPETLWCVLKLRRLAIIFQMAFSLKKKSEKHMEKLVKGKTPKCKQWSLRGAVISKCYFIS